ncbi:MAG: hypothetical protein KDC45_07120, partial [Bacteroidetes bacterium]|nr:hypothetical protein [Bacteroidota bacterium]
MRSTLLLLLILLTVPASLCAQNDASLKDRFKSKYVDSTGVLLRKLPTLDDSVFVWGKKYIFEGVDESGKETGLDVFDDQLLNLSLKLGEEEDRQVGKVTGSFFWLINNLTKIATLTIWSPDLGANRYYFSNDILREDLKLIRLLYENEGYFDARIVKYKASFSDGRRKVRIKVYIYEGKPTVLAEDPTVRVVSSIPIVDLKDELNQKDILSKMVLTKGSKLSRENIDLDRGTIQKLFASKGYSAAEVAESVDTASTDPYKALVEYKVFPGRYTVFGKTTVSGNYYKREIRARTGEDTARVVRVDTTKKIVDDEVVLLKVKYKENRTFDPDRLALTVGQINGLGVFRSVKPLLQKNRAIVDTSAEARQRNSVLVDSLKRNSDSRLVGRKLKIRNFGIPVDTVNIDFAVSERKERSI